MAPIILASKSPYRAQLLANAGLQFVAIPAQIDERAIEEPLLKSGMDGTAIAGRLAIAKAGEVSARHPGSIIIGSDQTLSLDGDLMHKPVDMKAALDRLLQLSGKTHILASAVTLVRDGETLWQFTDLAEITFRKLDPDFALRHLAEVGDVALTSVGAYQIEGKGMQLLEKVDGDFFTIMGLPLLPLLKELRNRELIDK